MKKILLLLFLGLISLAIMSQTTTKANLGISKTFTGITKAGDTMKKQSDDFFVGWDKGTIGRGYLEFDLSVIPSNATINDVQLRITSKVNRDQNYDGNINFYRCAEINDANAATWQLIQAVGEPELSINVPGEGLTQEFTSWAFKGAIQSMRGKKICFAINHKYESSKIMRLSSASNDLYLYINYTLPPGENSGNNGSTNIPCSAGPDSRMISPGTKIQSGDFFRVGISDSKCESLVVKEFRYDKNLFEEEGNDQWSYKLRTKQITETKKTEIYIRIRRNTSLITYDEWEYTYIFSVHARPQLIPITKSVCNGGLIEYKLTNYLEIFSDKSVSIKWEGLEKAQLISGQGYPTSQFKATANEYAKVRATLTYSDRSVVLENSQVWVGPPQHVYVYGDEVNTIQLPSQTYYIPLDIKGYTGENYFWSVDEYYNPPTPPVNPPSVPTQIVSSTKTSVKMRIASSAQGLPVRNAEAMYYSKNQCGWSKTVTVIVPIITERTPFLKSNSELPLINTSVPVSIQIYSFTSGELVYQDKKAVNFNINNTNIKKGIYIVKTTDAEGNVTQDKVMKTTD